MKRLFLLVLFLLIVCNLVFAQFAVDSTKTMNEDTFIALREATAPGTYTDEVMRFYWCKLIGIDPPPDGEDGEGDFRGERADYEPINKAYTYAKEAFWGAIGHDMPDTVPPTYPSDKLNLALDYLLDPEFPYYLSLDSVWVHIDNRGVNTIAMGDMLYNVAFIVDCLWYYVENDIIRESLYNKLDNLAWAFNKAIQWDNGGGDTRVYPVDPSQYGGLSEIKVATGMTNPRIYLDAALGYTGCVQI